MSQTITYKKELFDFINDLTGINNSIAFERVDEQIVVRKSDKNKTTPYILKAPAEYFDIDETVAFYKYDEFYKYLNTIKNPELTIDDPKIIISRGGPSKVNIKYTLSDEEGIINGPKKLDLPEWDVTFTLPREDLDEIVKINGLVKGGKAQFSCVDDVMTVDFYSSDNEHAFDKTFKCDRISEMDDDFTFIVNGNRFALIPSKHDYNINISSLGLMNMSLIHDDIEFDFYSGDAS